MLARTNASYNEKNTNSNIGVQDAMLVGTNEMITVRRLRMIPIKRVKKGEGERQRMSLLIRTLNAPNREKISFLVMWYLVVIDRLKCVFSNPRDAELLLCM
jgi:hypothetical protein